jgi:hypothetical protein
VSPCIDLDHGERTCSLLVGVLEVWEDGEVEVEKRTAWGDRGVLDLGVDTMILEIIGEEVERLVEVGVGHPLRSQSVLGDRVGSLATLLVQPEGRRASWRVHVVVDDGGPGSPKLLGKILGRGEKEVDVACWLDHSDVPRCVSLSMMYM